MSDFILHSFRRCPFAMRTRITLALKGIEYTVVEERLRDWSDWMQSNVPDPRVPILRHGEKIVRESNVINEYLNELVPTPQLIPEERKAEMHEWMSWWDEVKPQIDIYKYGKTESKRAEAKEILKKSLARIENALSQSWLFGEEVSLADIAIIPFIRQISRVQPDVFDFTPFVRVVQWMEQITETDWFKNEVMKKYPYAKEKSKS